MEAALSPGRRDNFPYFGSILTATNLCANFASLATAGRRTKKDRSQRARRLRCAAFDGQRRVRHPLGLVHFSPWTACGFLPSNPPVYIHWKPVKSLFFAQFFLKLIVFPGYHCPSFQAVQKSPPSARQLPTRGYLANSAHWPTLSVDVFFSIRTTQPLSELPFFHQIHAH